MLYLPNPFKRCSHCERYLLPTTEFFPLNCKLKSGLDSWCHSCHHDKTQEWRKQNHDHIHQYNRDYHTENIEKIQERELWYRQTFPEKRREAQRKWVLANPEKKRESRRHWYHANPEKVRVQKQRTYAKHKTESRERGRRWQRANPDKVYQATSRWRKAHPDKVRQFSQARRSRKFNLPCAFDPTDWQICLNYWHGCCVYCSKQQGLFTATRLTADHFIPVTSPDCPGTIPTNMLPACQSCNSSKHDHDPVEWLTRRFGKRKANLILKAVREYFDWIKGH